MSDSIVKFDTTVNMSLKTTSICPEFRLELDFTGLREFAHETHVVEEADYRKDKGEEDDDEAPCDLPGGFLRCRHCLRSLREPR